MQNITVVGKDSAARTAVIIALNSNFKINDLLPEQIYFDDLSAADLVIYIAEQPDQQIIDRLHECGKSIILIGRNKGDRDMIDLFIPIMAFQNFAAKGILKGIRLIIEFVDKFYSDRLGLDATQKKVIYHLSKSSSEAEILADLKIGRRAYYTILAQLRVFYGVSKNRQLIQIAQSSEFDQAC
jgi:hypothetical protein